MIISKHASCKSFSFLFGCTPYIYSVLSSLVFNELKFGLLKLRQIFCTCNTKDDNSSVSRKVSVTSWSRKCEQNPICYLYCVIILSFHFFEFWSCLIHSWIKSSKFSKIETMPTLHWVSIWYCCYITGRKRFGWLRETILYLD